MEPEGQEDNEEVIEDLQSQIIKLSQIQEKLMPAYSDFLEAKLLLENLIKQQTELLEATESEILTLQNGEVQQEIAGGAMQFRMR